MVERGEKIHKIGDEVYISCPGCNQTLPADVYGFKNFDIHSILKKKIRSLCLVCNRIYWYKKYKERKVFNVSGAHKKSNWLESTANSVNDVINQIYQINQLDKNEFRKFRISKKKDKVSVIFEKEVYAYKKDGPWMVLKFAGYGFEEGVGVTKMPGRCINYAKEDDRVFAIDIDRAYRKFCEKRGIKPDKRLNHREACVYLGKKIHKDVLPF